MNFSSTYRATPTPASRSNHRLAVYTGMAAIVTVVLTSMAAWITHVFICLKAGTWGFLIAGALLPPIAVVHGGGHWFGLW